MMARKTTSNTIDLGSKASNKTRVTTALVQRINSAFKQNDKTLKSLNNNNTHGSNTQQSAVRQDQQLTERLMKQANRQPQKQKQQAGGTRSTVPASLAASRSSTRPAAKKQRMGATRSINQLPPVALTVGDVVSDDNGEEEIHDEIVVRADQLGTKTPWI